MWRAPQALARHKAHQKQTDPNATPSSTPSSDSDAKKSTSSVSESGDDEDEDIALQDTIFDAEKAVCCSVEGGNTLVHGSGGRGYGLGATGITAGCYQWKVNSITVQHPHNNNDGFQNILFYSGRSFCGESVIHLFCSNGFILCITH